MHNRNTYNWSTVAINIVMEIVLKCLILLWFIVNGWWSWKNEFYKFSYMVLKDYLLVESLIVLLEAIPLLVLK